MLPFIKSQAYGNDFLLMERTAIGDRDPVALARAMCDRHMGAGADGLILYGVTPEGARMQLYNADGGRAEVSGNGVRCLAALVLDQRGAPPAGPAAGESTGRPVVIQTDAGAKTLTPIERSDGRITFRAAMGAARDVSPAEVLVGDRPVRAILLSMGNPHCVVPGTLPPEEEFRRLGSALERHPRFPEGTNIEFAEMRGPGALHILIWERGVGPTMSSGTGTCAAAAAIASLTPGDRDFTVTAPGGTQRVEIRADDIYLTGWAELVYEGRWPDARGDAGRPD